MSDGNLLDKVSESVVGVAESLSDHVPPSIGTDTREEEQYLLPPDLKSVLVDPMKDLGFPIDPKLGRVKDFSNKSHTFYRTIVKDGYLAFLYVGNKLLESNHGNDFAWIGILFSRNGAKGIFFFSDSSRVEPAYDTQAEIWEEKFGFQRARFFDRGYETTLAAGDHESRKEYLNEWFKLRNFTSVAQMPAATLTFDDLKNDQEKKERIVSIIANAAANAPVVTPQNYITDLVNRTNWPQSWKTQLSGMWDGNPEITARKLVNWALSKKINNADPSYTTIAGLLEPLIRTDTDRVDGMFLLELIQKHALITDNKIVQKIHDENFGSH